MSDEGSPTTYALIYAFLKKRSHEKAAAAVKKAAKDAGVVVLKDSLEETGQDDLNEIVRIWKEKKLKQLADTSSSESEDDDSDSETSSESDSSDADSCAKSTSKANGRADKKSKTNVSSESSSSEESDSTSESEREERPGIGAKPKASLKSIPKKSVSSSSVSSSDSSSTSSESSASSSSSDSEPNINQKRKSDKSATTPAPKAETNSSNVKITKKRRVSVSGHAKVTAVDEESKTPLQVSKQSGKNDGTNNGSATPLIIKDNGKKPRKSNTPFQRIRPEDVHFRDERLKDNSFMARGGAANDYGAKANQDLIVTRGDGFRKAKNKKKRGSYRGGEITLESHSIKFT